MRHSVKDFLIVICLILVGCSGERPECSERYCVLLELEGPFAINQPFTASVTVEPFEDISDLEINAFSNNPDVSFGQGHWVVDVTAGQPVVVTTTATISREGYFIIFGNAITYSHGVSDGIGLQMTQSGGVLNPTSDGVTYNPGASHTEGATYESSPPEPKPMPFDAYLPNPSPAEALAACDFSHASPSEWNGAGLSLTFYDSSGSLLKADQIVAGEMITIRVEFQAPWDSSPNTGVKLGLCLPKDQAFFDSADIVDGKKVWEIQTDPGVIFTENLTGKFKAAGVHVLPISGFVADTGEVYARYPRVFIVDHP